MNMATPSSSPPQDKPPPPVGISTFDHFVKFITDASGLERTFRLFQSITQILTSFESLRQRVLTALIFLTHNLFSPLLTLLLFPLLGSSDQHDPDNRSSSATLLLTALFSVPTLSQLRASFALGRRFFRVGRFLDSFRSAWKLYTAPSSKSSSGSAVGGGSGGLQSLQTHLTILANSFSGLYLLLETLHFPEVLLAATSGGVPSASASSALSAAGGGAGEKEVPLQLTTLWGPQLARTLHVEGQRFWFFALICGAGAGLLKLINLQVLRAVPAPGTGQNLGTGGQGEKEHLKDLRGLKEKQAQEREEFARTFRKVGRRVIADVLDVALPGTVVGWVNMDGGMVGLCMLGSTVLTGLEVWERCGGE